MFVCAREKECARGEFLYFFFFCEGSLSIREPKGIFFFFKLPPLVVVVVGTVVWMLTAVSALVEGIRRQWVADW